MTDTDKTYTKITDLTELKKDDEVRVTLSGRIDVDGDFAFKPHATNSDIEEYILGSWLKTLLERGSTVERIEPAPYSAKPGDVVRLHFANGRAIYTTLDGESFHCIKNETLRTGRNATPVAQGLVETLVRKGVVRGWIHGGEVISRASDIPAYEEAAK